MAQVQMCYMVLNTKLHKASLKVFAVGDSNGYEKHFSKVNLPGVFMVPDYLTH
jgi:hypothetical protein